MFLVLPFGGSQAVKVEDTPKMPTMELRPKMTIKAPPNGHFFIQQIQSFNFIQNWMRRHSVAQLLDLSLLDPDC